MHPAIKHLKNRPDTLIVQFIPGKTGSFNYYEDEGDNEKYKEGKYTTTTITQETNLQQGIYTVCPRKGAFDGMPSTRHYEFRLLSKLPAKQVKVDGTVYPYSAQPKKGYWTYNGKQLAIVINTPSKKCNTQIDVVVDYDTNQASSDHLIVGKMGQMSRIVQCNDSLKATMGNKIPALFTKLVKTRDRIGKNPKNTIAELHYFDQKTEAAFDELLNVKNAPIEKIKEWKDYILLGENKTAMFVSHEVDINNEQNELDDTNLWITGSAIVGNIAKLTTDPSMTIKNFRYHGKLQTGEFKIINTPSITATTKYYLPVSEDANAVGSCSMQVTKDASLQGWTVSVPDDYYKLKINAIDKTLQGELCMAKDDLYIVGGATEVGWDAGRAIRLQRDLNNPNRFIFSGILKVADSGDDRNMFKLLAQNSWSPVSFHPKSQGEILLGSTHIFENLAGDHKWAIDPKKQGRYIIEVDMLDETIRAKYMGDGKF